jgi:hypothetical protein
VARRAPNENEPVWPRHLAKYRPEDGWESEVEWELARVDFARRLGFKNFKKLPIIQKMAARPGGVEKP